MTAFSLLAVAAVAAGPAARPAPAFDRDAMAAAWQARQDKVKSLEVTAAVTVVYTRGGYSRQFSLGAPPPLGIAEVVPEAAFTLEHAMRLHMSGKKVRLELDRMQYYGREPAVFRRSRETVAFDEIHTKDMHQEIGADGKPTGKPKGSVDNQRKVWPEPREIMFAFRGRTQYMGPADPLKLNFVGRTAVIGGATCLELVAEIYNNGSSRLIWVDPARGWLPVREVQRFVDMESVRRLDIEYRTDAALGWVPAKWKLTESLSGVVNITTTAVIKTLAVNPKLDDKLFAIDYPVGTSIYDEPTGAAGPITADNMVPKRVGNTITYIKLSGSK